MALFTVKVKAASEKINITDVKVLDKSSTITVEDPTLESNTITSSVKFNEVNDYVIYEVTLENKDELDYTIDSVVDNNENSNLLIEYNYGESLLQGKTATLKIKMTYKNELEGSQNISLDNLEITMNLTKSDGTSTQVTINPATGDNIVKYIGMLSIAVVGIILIKKNYKVGKLFVILPLLVLPFAVLAAETEQVKIKFNNIELVAAGPTQTVLYYSYDANAEADPIGYQNSAKLPEPDASWKYYIKETTTTGVPSYGMELTIGEDTMQGGGIFDTEEACNNMIEVWGSQLSSMNPQCKALEDKTSYEVVGIENFGTENAVTFSLKPNDYVNSVNTLNTVFPTCNADPSASDAECNGSSVRALANAGAGYVYVIGDSAYCFVSGIGVAGCGLL
jgi:hypothetical protein